MNKRIVGLALIGGLLLLAGWAWAFSQDEPQAPARRARIEGRLERLLDLTSEQQGKIDALRKAHREQQAAVREEMRKVREEFRALRENLQSDPAKAESLIDRISKLKADQMKAGLRHRREMDQVLTPEQREKLKEIRAKMQQRMDRLQNRRQGLERFMGRRGFGRGMGRFNRMRHRGLGF